MDNLSESSHKVNTQTIAIFTLIFLSILAVVGYVRLRQLTPDKQPIRLEYGEPLPYHTQ